MSASSQAVSTVIAYLPVQFFWTRVVSEDIAQRSGSRTSKQRMLHEAMRLAVQPLWDAVGCGIDAQVGGKKLKRCHPVLMSYVVDSPEATDMLGTVHGTCPRCQTGGRKLAHHSLSAPRRRSDTLRKLSDMERLRDAGEFALAKEIEANMWSGRLSTQLPCVFHALFSGVVSCLDPYSVFRFEAMHNLYLGISKTLKELLGRRMTSSELYSKEFLDRERNPRSFPSIRVQVLQNLNNLLQLVQRDSPCLGCNFDMTRRASTRSLNGLFTDDGVASMLEASDLRDVDQVMPFVAALADRLCGEADKMPVTRTTIPYMEMVDALMRRHEEPGFTEDDLSKATGLVRKFRRIAEEVYTPFQRSGFAFPKWHFLLHAVDDIRTCGSLVNYVANAYEASHKVIKTAFASTSRRKRGGQGEALYNLSRRQFTTNLSMEKDLNPTLRLSVVQELACVNPRPHGVLTRNKEDALREDAVGLFKGSRTIRRDAITHFLLRQTTTETRMKEPPEGPEQELTSLCSDVGGVCRLRWFLKQVGSSTSIRRSSSAIVSGARPPTSSSCRRSVNKILIADDGSRELQRIVSAHSIYKSVHAIQDCVMIEARAGRRSELQEA